MKKLAIIITHPIQYYAPIFRLLHQRGVIRIKVYYTMGKAGIVQYDAAFQQTISWDIPLTNGYPIEWVDNIASDPGTSAFNGVNNPSLIGQLDSWKPDGILIFGWANNSHFKVMRHFHGKLPIFFRGDSTLLDNLPWYRRKVRFLWLTWIYRFIDHAFYTGTNNLSYFKHFGLKDSQLSFAPHAVDNDRFAGDYSDEARRLRTNLGLVPDDILILFAGKFEAKKDPVLLLKAFLKSNDNNTHLLFAGNGELQVELEQMAAHHKRVHFIGFQNQRQMPAVYQACDLFCLPSKGPAETWGLAINEAMACGRAVLVSDKVGCAADLVEPGVNGYIFSAGSLDDLYKYLRRLTVSKIMLTNFGMRSSELIRRWNFLEIATAVENRLNEPNHPDNKA